MHKMKVLKNSFNRVDWNQWQTKDRVQCIEEKIDKLASL